MQIVMATFPWDSTATPLRQRLAEVSLTGDLNSSDAVTATVGLATLVGALAVAIVVAPRVSDESVTVDRVALAYWGTVMTRASAVAAGATAGLALTQLMGDEVASTWMLVVLAAISCSVAATSVQRVHDRLHGGLTKRTVMRLEEAKRLLRDVTSKSAGHRVRSLAGHRHPTKKRDALSTTSVFLYFPSLIAGVALARDLLVRPSNVADPHYWLDMVVLFAMAGGLGWLITWPWLATLRWRIGRQAYGKRWRPSYWLAGLASAAGIVAFSLPAWPGSEGTLQERVVALSIVVPVPSLIGALCAVLGRRHRGPWCSAWRHVLRQLRYEYRLASDRHNELGRLVNANHS